MRGVISPLTQYPFMAWCLIKHNDNFTFTFNNNTFVEISKILRMKLHSCSLNRVVQN